LNTPTDLLSSHLKTLIGFDELRQFRNGWRQAGQTVAFVPTMGALHDGHLRLVLEGKRLADRVICSIFVNPTQFAPGEDFDRYPRTVREDVEKLATVHADAVFLPNAAAMWPEGHQTSVSNRKLASELCGVTRPGHFEGVLTVVLKLFNLVQPDFALFGKKDYQQWRMIELMCRDLNLPVKVIGMQTVRESDGLAMSSRNRYLGEDERKKAAQIHLALASAQKLFAGGVKSRAEILKAVSDVISGVPEMKLEYAEIRRQKDLGDTGDSLVEPAVILVAVRYGSVRLIDNMELG
jgi:pantoate--beta-alanine ligase